MFLNSVILVLQEVLEAALLIGVMLVLANLLERQWGQAYRVRPIWVFHAILLGFAGAWLYGYFMPEISTWFGYVGIEVVNALIQLLIIAWLLAFAFRLPRLRGGSVKRAGGGFAALCMVFLCSLVIIREGAEVYLYMQGLLANAANPAPAVMGGLLAAGIGISAGILLYYSLVGLPLAWTRRLSMVLLALFSGNMAAQAVLLLTQADWLPYTPELWNSSGLLAEYTVSGQLLYALVGYEANPSALQAACYLAGALLIVVSPLFRSFADSAEKRHA